MNTTCVIYSKSYELPYNIWTNIRNITKHNTNQKIQKFKLDDLMHNMSIGYNTGYGIFACCDNTEIYVITCNHIINNSNDIYCYVNIDNIMTKIYLEYVGGIKEVDVAILKIKNINENMIKNIDCIDLKIDYMSSLSFAKEHFDTIHLLHQGNCVSIENKLVFNYEHINMCNIRVSHLKSKLVPKIPLFTFTLESSLCSNGLSGTPICIVSDAKPCIIGLTFALNVKEGYLEGMPIYFVKLFANKIIKSSKHKAGKTHELYGCVIKSTFADIYINDILHHAYVCLNDTPLQIKKDHVILKINDKPFTECGNVHDDILNYDVNFDTYMMMMANMPQGTFTLTTLKQNELNMKTYTIISRPLDQFYNVHINDEHTYLYLNGLIYCELSEELIFSLCNNNVNINKKYIETYSNVSNTNAKKCVVLIDIDDALNNNNLKNVCMQSGHLLTLDKIGMKKINNINDVISTIKSKNNTITFNYTVGSIVVSHKILL